MFLWLIASISQYIESMMCRVFFCGLHVEKKLFNILWKNEIHWKMQNYYQTFIVLWNWTMLELIMTDLWMILIAHLRVFIFKSPCTYFSFKKIYMFISLVRSLFTRALGLKLGIYAITTDHLINGRKWQNTTIGLRHFFSWGTFLRGYIKVSFSGVSSLSVLYFLGNFD